MRATLDPYPVTTLNQPPTSAGQLETALSHRTGMWSGGDNAPPVLLPDRRILWLYGDTWVHGTRPDGTPANGLVRNSVIIQDHRTFTALLGPQVTAAFLASKPGCWLWPIGGCFDRRYGLTKIVCLRMTTDPGPWAFRIDGVDVANLWDYDWSASAVATPVEVPVDVNWSEVTVTGDDIYVYGWRPSTWTHHVARTTITQIDTDPWVYWTGTGWTPDPTRLAPIQITNGPLRAPHVIQDNNGFLASSHLVDATHEADIHTWRAASPTGPFTPTGVAATIPVPDGGWISYAGRVARIGPPGTTFETVAMHSINGGHPYTVTKYGPHYTDARRPT